jgi:hypothetical protein
MNASSKLQGRHTYQNEDISYWQNHIKQIAQSKLSRAAYCRQHDVNYDRFCYWHKRLSKQKPNKLLPVEVVTSTVPEVQCTLEFTNGARLFIYSQQSLDYILKVL